ncbi:MAG TPA: copper resistance protein B [Pseudomonadales bacterium]|nr:copper resistance protein B [Pseudomonadales bacterium]
MYFRKSLVAICLTSFLPISSYGQEEIGPGWYHAFELETGLRLNQEAQGLIEWDLDGWVGTDENKIRLKFKSEPNPSDKDEAEFVAMFSHNISTFWDAQVGLRLDTQPESLIYAVIGFEGLAPYFLETEAHLFISEQGDFNLTLRYEKDFPVTTKLIAKPYIEANGFAQDIVEQDIGSGLSNAEFGIQTRFEFSAAIALYADLKYDRKFGETKILAKNNGEEESTVTATLGFKFLF